MDISDLHYFTAAADAGSFSSAGKALGRDPSTLSRRIGGLEDELGLPLFERRHGGVLLTSGGKAVLGHVRRALAEINLIKAAALKNGAATVGEVGRQTALSYTGDNLTVNLVSGRATDNATGVTDTLIGITEVAVAGSNDTLIADGGTDVLSAAGSGDTLIGGSATTTLVSNAGGNTLEAGTDRAVAFYGADSA